MRIPSFRHLPWLLTALLAACSHGPERDRGPDRPVDVSGVPDAVPQEAPRSRYGNPRSYTVLGKTYHVMDDATGFRQRGLASWYGVKFHGRRTSSGEPYDMYAMTAAHKTLPLPTWVKVTNLENGREVVVKVNDRGPFHPGRIIDLSYTAAAKLGVLKKGTAPVEIVALTSPGKPLAETLAAARDPDARRQTRPSGLKPDTAPSAGQGDYIQAGAFRNPFNARSLQRRLARAQASPVEIRSAEGLHRVIVGPITSPTRRDALLQLLETWGVQGHHRVQ